MKQFIADNKTNIIKWLKVISTIIVFAIMLLVYPFNVISVSERGYIYESNDATIEMVKDSGYRQDISEIGRKLYGIEMVFEKVSVGENDTFSIRIYEDEEVVFERLINPGNLIADEKYYLMTNIPMDKNKTYVVEYDAHGLEGTLEMYTNVEYKYASSPNKYETTLVWGIGILLILAIWFAKKVLSVPLLRVFVFYVGGCTFVMYHFMREYLFSVLMDKKILLGVFILICSFILAAGCVNLYLIYIKKETKVERFFLFNMLSWGMVYMLTFIPYTAPDELAHFAGANMQANKIMQMEAVNEYGQAYVRLEDETGRYNIEPGADDIYVYYTHFADDTVETEYVPYTGRTMDKTHFVAYLPQSIAVIAARLLQLNNSWLLLLGRVFSLVAYTAIVYWAIKITPIGKWIFYWFSQIPIAIELAASFSYDSMSNAWAFLFVAIAIYYIIEKEKISIKDQIFIIVVALIGLPIKAIYLPFILLLLLISGQKFKRGKWEKFIFPAIGIVISIVGVVLINLLKASTFLSSSTHIENASANYVESAISLQQRSLNYAYEIPDFIRNLELYFRVTFHTIIERLDFYLSTMIGSKLGAMDVEIPYYVVFGFLILLLVIIVMFSERNKFEKWQKRGIILSASVSALMLEAIFILMTPREKFVITGIQGRYFIPIVLLLLLLVEIKNIEVKNKKTVVPVIGLNIMNMLTILYSLTVMLNR